MRRALKVLTDREVTPQLGLLKSTLLQLDSTFSERTYGVGSFRDFAQKLANAGHVTLREHGRNVLVELRDGAVATPVEEAPADCRERREHESSPDADMPQSQEPRAADGVREVRRLFQSSTTPPRWPMYIRQAKQFMRNVDSTFDERKFGFGSLNEIAPRGAARGPLPHGARLSGLHQVVPRSGAAGLHVVAACCRRTAAGRRRQSWKHEASGRAVFVLERQRD